MDRKEKLKLLKDLGGIPEEEFDRLFISGINDIKNELNKLKLLCDKNDKDGMIMAAHAIKGISANYRIKEVFELSKLIGSACRENKDSGTIKELIEKIESEVAGPDNI
ncbi:MAG: hypothetical protein MUC95_04265 [Spirochaetes bacterium]|jgi:HPt (histidine-containing phosphotransfer) domain-containing protein|nr:hypothetical protein [Spirochaetota bacterium]